MRWGNISVCVCVCVCVLLMSLLVSFSYLGAVNQPVYVCRYDGSL